VTRLSVVLLALGLAADVPLMLAHSKPPENCAPSYPEEYIPPPPPPDLDCKDIPYRNFRVLWNVPDPDPHHFDGDHDGIGCET
jgi:hypothetical protein